MWPKEIIQHLIRDYFSKRDVLFMLQEELREATVKKLQAESALDYAKSVVDYNNTRIYRLRLRIKELEGKQ